MFTRNIVRRLISSSSSASTSSTSSSFRSVLNQAVSNNSARTIVRTTAIGAVTLGLFFTTARAEEETTTAEPVAEQTTSSPSTTEATQETKQETTATAEDLKNVDLTELIRKAHDGATKYRNAVASKRSPYRSSGKRIEDDLAALKKVLPASVYNRIREAQPAQDYVEKSAFAPKASTAKFNSEEALARLGDDADGPCGELFQQTLKHYERVGELLESFTGLSESEVSLKFSEEYVVIREANNVSLALQKCMVDNGIPVERFVEVITPQ